MSAKRFILNETSYHGSGAIKEIITEVKSRNFQKALIVTDADLVRFKVVEKVTTLLDENKFPYEVFDKVKAGFGGPAVRPIAVRLVYELVQAINQLPENERVPVVAIGGVAGWQDVVEFIMAGATAVQVGTNTFANPMTMLECIEGLAEFMKRKGYKNIQEMKGIAQ